MHAFLLILCVTTGEPAYSEAGSQSRTADIRNFDGTFRSEDADAMVGGCRSCGDPACPNVRPCPGHTLPLSPGSRVRRFSVWRRQPRTRPAVEYYSYYPSYNYQVLFDYPWHPTRCAPPPMFIYPVQQQPVRATP